MAKDCKWFIAGDDIKKNQKVFVIEQRGKAFLMQSYPAGFPHGYARSNASAAEDLSYRECVFVALGGLVFKAVVPALIGDVYGDVYGDSQTLDAARNGEEIKVMLWRTTVEDNPNAELMVFCEEMAKEGIDSSAFEEGGYS